jgi:hypothetical protein
MGKAAEGQNTVHLFSSKSGHRNYCLTHPPPPVPNLRMGGGGVGGGWRIDLYNVHRVLQGFWFTPPLNFFTPTPEAFFPPNVVQILYI